MFLSITLHAALAMFAMKANFSLQELKSKLPCSATSPFSDVKFAPGQVWSYKARDVEPDSTLTILKVESLSGKTIVHIRLDSIRLRSCEGASDLTVLEHAPFDRSALDRSVTKLLRSTTVPSFKEGYSQWRTACGGVYTITVAEMLAVDEQTWNRGKNCNL